MHRMWEQYDPDGETGMAIIAEIQTLVKRLYEQYGTDGTDDETLIADLEALMHELWQKYGPGSDINKDFTVAWRDLLTKYGVDSAAVEDFSDEMNAILEAMWEKYGPGGESRDAMLAEIKSLLGAIGASIGEGDIGQWISTLFITESQPASNSAPVKAANMSRSIVSRLSNAAGLQPNDVDASVTVITKNEVCLAFVIGENQQRKAVDGVSVRVRDATKPDMPLLQYLLDEGSNQLVLQRPTSTNGITANAIASVLIANATTASSFDLELTVHDLSATHRVYKGWDGQKWLDIIMHNYAAFGDNPKLTCVVYVDGAGEPYYVNLPYYDQSIANRTTQTISMPLSALVDDPSAHSRARVEVKVVGREDCALVNNEFTVYLGGNKALRFVTEPEDVTAQEGEDVAFAVEAAGGTKPYTYQCHADRS